MTTAPTTRKFVSRLGDQRLTASPATIVVANDLPVLVFTSTLFNGFFLLLPEVLFNKSLQNEMA